MKKIKQEKRRLTIQTDYHTHTNFSSDAHNTPEAMCAAALNLGIDTIAFTEHAEWYGCGPGFPGVSTYMNRIAKCQRFFGPAGLKVLSGVELGNPHDFVNQAQALLSQHAFDVTIGSIHFVNGHNIHFEQCFAAADTDEIFHAYFLELRQMVESFPVDFVAHFDRIFWQARLLHIPFDPFYHEEVIRDALAAVAHNTHGLELNTKLLGNEPNWHGIIRLMLGWYREAGGQQVLVNSDAHHVHDLGKNQAIALHLLSGTGLKIGRLPASVLA